MTWPVIADIITSVCVLTGALLSLIAAVGLLRFPDLLTRMHAGTKPQVLGLLLILVGVGVQFGGPDHIGMLFAVAMFQLLTAPISAHMVGRAAYLYRHVHEEYLVIDELTPVMGDGAE